MTNKETFSLIRHLSNLELQIGNLMNRLNELLYFAKTPNNDDEDGIITEELKQIFLNYETLDDELHRIRKSIPKSIENVFHKSFGVINEPMNEDN